LLQPCRDVNVVIVTITLPVARFSRSLAIYNSIGLASQLSTLRYGKFGPIYRTSLIAVEVQCMYVNYYAVWVVGRVGWRMNFFWWVCVLSPNRKEQYFWTAQCNVYKANVPLWCMWM